MREIKFRGKDIKTGEWVYGAYASDGMRKVILVRNSFEEDRIYDGHFSTECHEYEVHPKTVGQLTGLKDKNGVEIYEGDVIRRKSTRGHNEGQIYNNVIEYWVGRGGCGFREKGKRFTAMLSGNRVCSVEVIGNIYENPDLLTTDNK